jgi:hypothetical protein
MTITIDNEVSYNDNDDNEVSYIDYYVSDVDAHTIAMIRGFKNKYKH